MRLLCRKRPIQTILEKRKTRLSLLLVSTLAQEMDCRVAAATTGNKKYRNPEIGERRRLKPLPLNVAIVVKNVSASTRAACQSRPIVWRTGADTGHGHCNSIEVCIMPESRSGSVTTRHLLTIAAAGTLALTAACGGDGFFPGDNSTITTGTAVVATACQNSDTGVVDGCGSAISTVDIHDPVVINVENLAADGRFKITVTDPSNNEITPSGGLLATADENGKLIGAAVVQNMADNAETGEYTITLSDASSSTVVTSLTYTVADRPRVRCTDANGNDKSSFLASDTVYAKVEAGGGTLADGDYNVYVRSDLNVGLEDQAYVGGPASTVTVANGSGIVDLGTYSSGAYDVIVDLDGDNLYDQGTDLISHHHRMIPCFAVQTANASAAIVQQIATDRQGNPRELFDPNADIENIRDIYATVTATQKTDTPSPAAVTTYLVGHKDTWNDGDSLSDSTSGTETALVQNDVTSLAPWLVWEQNDQSAGCYDVVVDINQNGTFDYGTDFVDNNDGLDIPVQCGVRVANPNCESNVTISSHSDGQTVTSSAITLAGTVSGTPDRLFITISAGPQTNTIQTTVSGSSFSAVIPLFNGANNITVWAAYPDGSHCAKTITVTSSTELALFRAQLTWDGDTDMDLHVVRPGGSYTAGGGGSDDCNYSNCKVDNGGIDWGTAGDESDNAFLDVDCISCGTGIENIWMNKITENGTYNIYVDAFSGSETNVTVTIFIRGAAVGQVNCGSMSAGTNTDSCFVGTINWTGGESGNGSFTPQGTLADDF